MKAYIKPATLEVALHAQTMLAASDPDTITTTVGGGTVTEGWADSRRRGPWDSSIWSNMNEED